MGLGSLFFVIQGFLLGNLPLAVTNVITGGSSAVITVIKLRNDAKKKKKS